MNLTLRDRIAELESELATYAGMSNERLLAELPGRTASVLQSAMDAAVGLLADAKKEMSFIHAEARQRATTIVAKAESEALELVREASEEAEATVRAARLRGASLVDEALKDREEVVAGLERRRAVLLREVAGLEARLRALQEAHELAEKAIEAYRWATSAEARPADPANGEVEGAVTGDGGRGRPRGGGSSDGEGVTWERADAAPKSAMTAVADVREAEEESARGGSEEALPAPARESNGARALAGGAGMTGAVSGTGSVANLVPHAAPGKRAVLRLLFVADGEGFRTSLAVALMNRDIRARRIGGVSVRYALAGELAPAPAKVISGLARRGIDITAAERVPLTKRVVESADLILAMTRENVEAVVALAPSVAWRTFTVTSFVRRGQAVDERSSKESLDQFLARLDRRGDRPPSARPEDDDIAARNSGKGYYDTVTEQLGLLSYEIGALLWPGRWNGQPRQQKGVGPRAVRRA